MPGFYLRGCGPASILRGSGGPGVAVRSALAGGIGLRAGHARRARHARGVSAERAAAEFRVDVRADAMAAIVELAAVVGRAAVVTLELAREQHVVARRREAAHERTRAEGCEQTGDVNDA